MPSGSFRMLKPLFRRSRVCAFETEIRALTLEKEKYSCYNEKNEGIRFAARFLSRRFLAATDFPFDENAFGYSVKEVKAIMMKRKILSRVAVAVMTACLLVPLLCASLTGCGKTPEPPELTVESIALDYSGAKTQFEWGESFSTDGLKVIATMSDESTQEISVSDCAVTKPVWDLPGNKFIRVMYQGKSATYTVTLKERAMPVLDKTPLFAITGETPNAVFTVEAESINLTKTNVQAQSGKTLIVDTADENVSGGKYLADYAVKNNYFGFGFTAEHEYTGVTLVLYLANSGESVLSLGESFDMYLNYKGVAESGALDVSVIPTLPAASGASLDWQTRAIRNLTIPQGENTLSIDVFGGNVPCIDKIEFYVGRRFIANSFVEISEHTTYIKEFEDFNLEKVLVRADMVSAHNLKPGELYTEVPTTNLENTSGGKSTGGLDKGSEISTVIKTPTEVILDITLVAAYPVPYRIKNSFEFYIDGNRLDNVEDKDICKGDYKIGQWWEWQDTYLGRVTLSPGDHIFDVRSTSDSCNLDCFKFKVISGDLPEGGGEHNCAHICPRCSKCNDTDCTHSACADKCECGHICADECPKCGKCLTDCAEEHCEQKCECPENIDVAVNKLGEAKVEFETLDSSNVITRSDAVSVVGSNKYAIGANQWASGGQKIHFVGRGSSFTVRIYVEEEAVVNISLTAGGVNYDVNGNMLITMDGDEVEYTGDGNFAGNIGTGEWRTVTLIENMRLSAGVHTLCIAFLGTEPTDGAHPAPPDLDYITVNAVEYGGQGA